MTRFSRGHRARMLMKAPVFAPALSIVFLLAVAKAAVLTGAIYLLFPELAALSYDVFKRPDGAWARSPVMLAITPAVTATMGTAIARSMPYGLWSTTITIVCAIAIVRSMRSPIVPAISAAFLPLSFGITSWWYPAAITAVTATLAAVSTVYNRILPSSDAVQASTLTAGSQPIALQRPSGPGLYRSFFFFAGFLLVVYGLAAVTRWRLVLFPPLVVIAFETFVNNDARPRAIRHVAVALACFIAAVAGLAASLTFGTGPTSVAFSLLVGALTLRVLRLHFPPALTVGLLPQIIPNPDWSFVLAVLLGVTALSGAVLLTRACPLMRARSILL